MLVFINKFEKNEYSRFRCKILNKLIMKKSLPPGEEL